MWTWWEDTIASWSLSNFSLIFFLSLPSSSVSVLHPGDKRDEDEHGPSIIDKEMTLALFQRLAEGKGDKCMKEMQDEEGRGMGEEWKAGVGERVGG